MRIVGVTEGLRAGSMKHPERKIQRAQERAVCKLCGGIIPQRKRGFFATVQVDDEHGGACIFCCRLFGLGLSGDPFGLSTSVTSLSPEDCITRLEALRADNWGIILKAGTFGTQAGHSIEIEPGDIVKIHRAGLSDSSNEAAEYCSQSRSKERFTIEIMIGPLPLILWPHEIAAVSFLTIMDLKRAGELEESYVAQEDECGYFRPTDEIREQIYACFGRLTGMPR